MKKLFTLSLLFVLFACVGVFAQDKQIKFSLSPSIALPQGIISDLVTVGGTLEVKGEYPLNEAVNFYGSLGFGLAAYKSNISGSASFIPALVGLTYTQNRFHAGFGVGYVSYKLDRSIDRLGGFSFRPQMGFDITDKFQLNFNYTATSTKEIDISYIGISPVIKF